MAVPSSVVVKAGLAIQKRLAKLEGQKASLEMIPEKYAKLNSQGPEDPKNCKQDCNLSTQFLGLHTIISMAIQVSPQM